MKSPRLAWPGITRSLLMCCAGTVTLAACGRAYVMTERGPQAYYQTGHPVQDVSRDIERVLRSVRRTQISVWYDVFRFARTDLITAPDLLRIATYAKATETYSIDHAVIGTATIHAHRGNRVELLTNEHVTRVPDTIIAYYGPQDEAQRAAPQSPRYVESVAIKRRQLNLVNDLGDVGMFRVIARDSARDIALIAVDIQGEPGRTAIDVLSTAVGDPAKLVWGSFVYAIGFPQGFKMVTRGIVSDPGRGRDNEFMLDGLFNRGMSGGPILAVRGDTGELEWVGIARAASSHPELIVAPERKRLGEDGVALPYDGPLYVEQVSRIDHGVTFAVPMTAIQRFLRANGR